MSISEEFNQISTCLNNWPDGDIPRVDAPHLQRFASCLTALKDDPSLVGWADLAVLTRQALRSGTNKTPQPNLRLTVPNAGPSWPTEEQWSTVGISALPDGEKLQLSAGPWCPVWLEGSEIGVDARVAEAPHWKKDHGKEPKADPFLSTVFPSSGLGDTYASEAQRDAVRMVISCEPGATVLVGLPTGSGKSTVALAPAFLQAPGVSIFVVPTVALALDQERRVRELTGDSLGYFAYTGDTPFDVKKEIAASIRAGSQTIVFTSPESLTGYLAAAFFDAAMLGAINYFVVDEAHLVDQWGTEFRPQFQAMAGLRSELLEVQSREHQPFRTVLMTATLSPSSTDLIVDLFGNPGPLEIAISNRLRPEPGYWSAEFSGLDLRTKGIVESVLNLPRPAIVYCSRPIFAKKLYKELLDVGFKRAAVFSGDTSDNERKSVLAGFREEKLDLVVATSAFGLGVDQSDVRTVIHACVPETIDRYYQEVGRAGRDGAPSIAVMCWTKANEPFGSGLPPRTEGDLSDAHSFSHPRMIGSKLGLNYWAGLLKASSQLDGGRLKLPLSVIPIHLENSNEEVERWHVRTIGLLIRAGLLRPGWLEPTGREEVETEKVDSLVVGLPGGRINEATWADLVAPVRERVTIESDARYKAMCASLEPNAAVCEIIRDAYDLSPSERIGKGPHVRPVITCGGCPNHRTGKGIDASMPFIGYLKHPGVKEHGINQLLKKNNIGYVTYDPNSNNTTHFEEALRALVANGVSYLRCPPEFVMKDGINQLLPQLHQLVSDRTLFVNQDSSAPSLLGPPCPNFVIVGTEQKLQPAWFTVQHKHPVVLALPDVYQHPDFPVKFTEVVMGVPDISEVPRLLRRSN